MPSPSKGPIACYEEPVVPVYNKIDSQNMEVTLNVKLTAPKQVCKRECGLGRERDMLVLRPGCQ